MLFIFSFEVSMLLWTMCEYNLDKHMHSQRFTNNRWKLQKKALFHLIIFKLTLMFALFVKVEVHRNLCLLWQSKHCSYR